MEDYKMFKQEIRRDSFSKSKNIPLAIQVLLLYLIFNSLNMAGRIYMQDIYQKHFSSKNNILNIQWFCYQIVSILGLSQLPKLINRLTFRSILLMSSTGPQIYLLPALYCVFDGDPDYIVVYLLVVIASLIGGILQTIFIFGTLYYLSNLSFGDDKILYYCSLFFMQNLQWLLGSSLLYIFSYFSDNTQEACVQLIISQVVSSLLFLTIFEPINSKLSRTKDQVLTLIETKATAKQTKIQNLRSLVMNGAKNQDEEQRKAKSEEEFKNIMNNMTLQCFSLDQSSLTTIIEKDKFNNYTNNYFKNIFITFKELHNNYIGYLLNTIFTVALIEAYLYIQLVDYVGTIDDQSPSVFKLTNDAYFYVGIGYVMGCFSIGIFGDLKDKFRWLLFQMSLLQFGFIFVWLIRFQDSYGQIFIEIFCAVVGFCCSSMTSTIVSILSYEFTELIYMTDALYIIYTSCFAFAALILIVANYTINFTCLIMLQVVGFLNYPLLFRYYNLRIKKYQN